MSHTQYVNPQFCFATLRPAPQISKLVTHGVDRPAALAGMRRALDNYVIRGVQHNAPLLRSVLDVPAFVAGHVSTAFLAEHYPTPEASAPDRLPLSAGQEEQLLALAALLWVGKQQRLRGGDGLQVGGVAVVWGQKGMQVGCACIFPPAVL